MPPPESGPPPSRWALASRDGVPGYNEHFAELVRTGVDVDGEARLADTLLPRRARVLDIGSGMGRVSAALLARGHDVTSVEPDGTLVEQAQATYDGLATLPLDALLLTPELLVAHDRPASYDLIVCVGNVLVFLAEGTETDVLRRARDLLAPGGRVLAGFHPVSVRHGARDYPPVEFTADVEAAGLRVQHRFGSYELGPPNEDYTVWVLEAAP